MEENISSALIQVGAKEISCRKSIFLYPITPAVFVKGANNYIIKLIDCLNEDFTVINKQTRLGIFDLLRKLPKCNIVYFNWIEDIADKRLGYIQIPVLLFILICCKIFNIKIAWFIHNDISHTKKNWFAKKMIKGMMRMFADVAFTHSSQLPLLEKMPEIRIFEHPIEDTSFVKHPSTPLYDVLVWGAVSPYKGILEFTEFNHLSNKLDSLKILIAGKFSSPDFYNNILRYQKQNLELRNKMVEEDELIDLFAKSRYILFCYRSASVLSSAALCKSLSYGKTIIGPNIGAFKELGKKGLIYTYDTFEDLADLLVQLKASGNYIDQQLIKQYIRNTSWTHFKNFLVTNLNDTEQVDLELSPSPAFHSTVN